MSPLEREALKRAVEKQRKTEAFERSLGRTYRNVGLDYDAYILIISEVRVLAKREKITLEEAALRLASAEEK
jgi:hypothetical protein